MITSLVKNRKHFWLYMLELEAGNYYIGITARPDPYVRIQEHFNGTGAAWTKRHRPLRVSSLKPLGLMTLDQAEHKEENATRIFMHIYGYNHVRGGTLNFSGNYVKFQDKYFQTNLLNSHWA